MDAGAPAPDCGYVYAVTGALYTELAERSARSLRAVSPDAAIDLYTDQHMRPGPDGPFDRIHGLDNAAFKRPKFEALVRTRFRKAIYIDADTHLLADISNVFDVLERYDLAAAHAIQRNAAFAHRIWREPVPHAFPQINSGVMGVRRGEATTRLLGAVGRAMDAEDFPADQPILREMVWNSPDIRLAVLPLEYNFKDVDMAAGMYSNHPGPRVLHLSRLSRAVRKGKRPAPAPATIRPDLMRHLEAMVAADRSIHGDAAGPKIAPLYRMDGQPLPEGRLARLRHRIAHRLLGGRGARR